MGQQTAEQTGSESSWQSALLSAWIAGALIIQTPFQILWRLGNGTFGYNLMIGLAAVIVGVVLFAGATRLLRILSRGNANLENTLCKSTTILLGSAAVLFIATLSFRSTLFPYAYFVGLACTVAWLAHAVFSVLRAEKKEQTESLFKRVKNRTVAAARQPWPFNGVFWMLVFLALIAKDFYTAGDIEGANAFEMLFIICGRLVTNAAFTLALVLAVQALLALTPKVLRWVVWTAASMIPVFAIAGFAIRQLWNKGLLEVLNDFTVSGEFNVQQELAASGLDVTSLQAGLLLAATVGLCLMVYTLLQRFSVQIVRCRLSTVPASLLFALIWFFAIAEQGLSMATKRTEIWREEHKVFSVHMGLFTPPPGLETIPVEVAEPQSDGLTEELLASAKSLPELERKPDIYILMIESWRSDSINETVTPFLYEFANTDCQQFGETYSGSNCTPLSWFTMFHSRLALHWADTVKGAESKEGLPGAYPVRLLKELGYETSVRAVCDLAYKNLGALNYGSDYHLADIMTDSTTLPEDVNIPNRERLIMQELRKQVRQSQPGGHLHFIAFDSPHYNYYWPNEDFTPLHEGCDGKFTYTNINPSPEKIKEVKDKYDNSVNWMDNQISEFVEFLKHEGRYDDATIIITGDHGEEFQEHGSWFHCSTLKKEQTAVPILIKWPTWLDTPPPQRQVSHLDVMPSILDMLGLDEKYTANLSGHSVLDENHPGETVISTIHRGMSNVGVCIIKDGTKANFTFRGLWDGGLPDKLYLEDYTDLNDETLSLLDERGERTHTEFIRERYPVSTSRFFKTFGKPSVKKKGDAG